MRPAASPRDFGRNSPDWGAVLRALHPVKPAASIAARIGAPVGTVEGWIKRKASPSGDWVCRLIEVYGPELLARVLPHPPVWVERVAMLERLDVLDAEAARLRADFAALGAEARRARP